MRFRGKKWLLYKWPDTKWEIGYIPSELRILFLLYSQIKKDDLFLRRLRKGCYEQQNFPLGREREEKQHSTSNKSTRVEMWSMKVEFRPSLHFLCLFIWMAARVQMLSSGRWTRLVGFHYSILLEAHLISRASGFISPQQVEGAANTKLTCLTCWVTQDMRCTLQLQQQSTCSTDNLLQFTMFPFSWKTTCSTTSGYKKPYLWIMNIFCLGL